MFLSGEFILSFTLYVLLCSCGGFEERNLVLGYGILFSYLYSYVLSSFICIDVPFYQVIGCGIFSFIYIVVLY